MPQYLDAKILPVEVGSENANWDLSRTSPSLKLFLQMILSSNQDIVKIWHNLKILKRPEKDSWFPTYVIRTAYLAASNNWVAICFLLEAGATHIALIPQEAGTGSVSRKMAPIKSSADSSCLGSRTVFFLASLWKLMLPNWSTDESSLLFLAMELSELLEVSDLLQMTL